MNRYPIIILTKEMINYAKSFIHHVEVKRTVASPHDTLIGILGELVYAKYTTGDFRNNNILTNKGQVDFDGVEVKTSAFLFSENLHLLVREDYALKRKPKFYVQIILDVDIVSTDKINPGIKAILSGFATSEEVDNSPKKDWGSKFGKAAGYLCHGIMVSDLHPMKSLKINSSNSIAATSCEEIMDMFYYNHQRYFFGNIPRVGLVVYNPKDNETINDEQYIQLFKVKEKKISKFKKDIILSKTCLLDIHQRSYYIRQIVSALKELEVLSLQKRITHCYRCKRNLDSRAFDICSKCNWIKCTCGACGCNY